MYSQIDGLAEPNQAKFSYAIEELKKNIKILDDSLKLKSFFIGDRITLADIILSSNLNKAFQYLITPDLRKKYVNLFRWYSFVRNQPPFIEFLGPIVYAETVFVPSQDAYKKDHVESENKAKSSEQKQEKVDQK